MRRTPVRTAPIADEIARIRRWLEGHTDWASATDWHLCEYQFHLDTLAWLEDSASRPT